MKKLKCISKIPSNEFICTDVTVGKIYVQDDGYNDVDDYYFKDDLCQKRYYQKRFFKEVDNDRNAGRKQKYTSPTKLKRIPIIMEGQIDEILKPYLNIKAK